MKNKILFLSIMVTIFFFACRGSKDSKKITITDFSKKRVDTLEPYKGKSYFSYYIKVKGHVDDIIKFERKDYYDVRFSGKIDTIINGDYYGEKDLIWIFDSYKATSGKLDIEYSL